MAISLNFRTSKYDRKSAARWKKVIWFKSTGLAPDGIKGGERGGIMPRNVGFIGLGIMGRAMARRLVDAGHRVTVWNRDASKAAEFVAAGARQAATPRAAAEENDVVITMVTDSAAVGSVILGPDGAIHGAKTGAVIVDMSTINPGSARRIGATLRARGIGFLDAPVTGMEVRAREG